MSPTVMRSARRRNTALKARPHVEAAHRPERLRRRVGGVGGRDAGQHIARGVGEGFQFPGRLLEALVLEQLLHEFPARVLRVVIGIFSTLVDGNEQAALICMSVAAITMKSPATSRRRRSMPCRISRYAA
jgi:hypothetical protein